MKRTGATGVADFPDAFRQSMGGWADPGSMKSYTVHGTAKRGQATAAMMAAITPSDVAVNSSNATHVSASTVVAAHVGGGVESMQMQQMHQLQQASIERMMKRMKRMERNMITATPNLFRVCKRPRPKQFRVNARDRRQGPEAPGGGRERSRGTARPSMPAGERARNAATIAANIEEAAKKMREYARMMQMWEYMRGKELHALEPKHFTKVVVADTPPGFKFVVDPFACKNHQGGLRGANNPPEPKEVVPNSNTIRVGNQLAEAKSCPVVALDLLLNKLPADAAGLFIKPNPAYEVSGKWYCNQKVGEHSLKSRVSSMFDTEEESFTSHSMKRTGATGVADFPDAFRQSMGGWADPGSMKSYTVHGTAKRGQATAAMMAAITPSDVAVNSSNATHVSASTVVAAHVGGGVESMQMQQMHQLQQASIERMMKRMKRMERNMLP
ncbi:hypothetical protein QJQ45_007807 [Haematococcus lacustris]|nr:hypothetical protein QJQ45_007807 [Haematococcus lacustris]